LVEISQFAGSDVLLAQGGGGNTSVKSADGTRMWIKASGFRLSEVRIGCGYLETDLPALVALMQDSSLAARSRALAHEESVRRIQVATLGAGRLRPSLETGFHAVLGRVVLHTHPVYVNAFACMEGGDTALARVLDEPVAWVRYEPPGYSLGVEVDRVCAIFQRVHGQPPAQIVLGNHGFIASAVSGAEAIAITLKLVRAGEAYFGPLPAEACVSISPPEQLVVWAEGLEQALRKRSDRYTMAVRAATRTALLEAAVGPDRWLTAGPLIPDDAVYSGHRIWKAEASQSPWAWLETEVESLPEKMIVVVNDLGVILAGPNHKMLDAMEENLLTHVLTRQLIARRGLARPLPSSEVDYLLSMESEKYRQAVAEGDIAVTGKRD
jgi:rhamnose utilization protein RhaD (predicted bifunctional aldolase and dehydrogenase)